IAELPSPIAYENAPPAEPFIQMSECATDIAELQPVTSAKIYGTELATLSKLLSGCELDIDDPNQWRKFQTQRSQKPAQFDDGRITYVQAELILQKPAGEEEASERASRRKASPFSRMLRPLDGYRLLSLKCNEPSTGLPISTGQLPTLVELSGLIHKPVGVVAAAKSGDQIIYEVDYCGLKADDTAEGLSIAEDTSVADPFPDAVWLTAQAQSISEFYVLYLVKTGERAVITAVKPADVQTAATFKENEGFAVK
ncbi:MAG: hypothetical protein JSW23_05285, partial [Planctomycetota bacterium]